MGRVNLHESKFLILAFWFYLLFQTLTSVQQYLSISFQDPQWIELADNEKRKNTTYILDTVIHLNSQYQCNFWFESLHVLIPCGGWTGVPNLFSSLPLSFFPTTYTHTASLPLQEGNTKTPGQKINKTRQAICPARTIRKQNPPVCHCKQSLGNILLFCSSVALRPSLALSSKQNCYKFSRKKGYYSPSRADNNRAQHKLFLGRCEALYSILINSRHSNPQTYLVLQKPGTLEVLAIF